MSVVGAGFGSWNINQTVSRLPKNPADKCTIVSISNDPIVDYKPTVFPSIHRIAGVKEGDYEVSVIEAGSWFKEQQDGPILEIYVTSEQRADAFIKDYISGLPGYIPDIASPGLFFCYSAYTKESIKKYTDPINGKTFDTLLAEARARQKRWFTEVVRMADAMWARSNNNPLTISRDARLAAERLGLKDQKPWMADQSFMDKSNCQACGFQVNLLYPICPNCRAIVNPERAKELNIKFASQ